MNSMAGDCPQRRLTGTIRTREHTSFMHHTFLISVFYVIVLRPVTCAHNVGRKHKTTTFLSAGGDEGISTKLTLPDEHDEPEEITFTTVDETQVRSILVNDDNLTQVTPGVVNHKKWRQIWPVFVNHKNLTQVKPILVNDGNLTQVTPVVVNHKNWRQIWPIFVNHKNLTPVRPVFMDEKNFTQNQTASCLRQSGRLDAFANTVRIYLSGNDDDGAADDATGDVTSMTCTVTVMATRGKRLEAEIWRDADNKLSMKNYVNVSDGTHARLLYHKLVLDHQSQGNFRSVGRQMTVRVHVRNAAGRFFSILTISGVLVGLETIRLSPTLGYVQTPGNNQGKPYWSCMNAWTRIYPPLAHVTLLSMHRLHVEWRLMCLDFVEVFQGGRGWENRVWRVCRTKPPDPLVLDTRQIFVHFKSGVETEYLGFRLMYSFHPEPQRPYRIDGNLWNCSVPEWSRFQRHFRCDVDRDCERGEDEAWCFYTPLCGKGRVTVDNKCYSYAARERALTWNDAHFQCLSQGGLLVSLNTAREWAAVTEFLQKRRTRFPIYVGLTVANPTLPILYRGSLQWVDGSIAFGPPDVGIPATYCGVLYSTCALVDMSYECNFPRDVHFLCEMPPLSLPQDRRGPTGRRRVIPGSIPTKNLPSKSVETPKPPERKPPVSRDPPPLPLKVQYFTLTDVRKDAKRLPPPWIILEDRQDMLSFAVVNKCTINIRVNISVHLTTEVFMAGMPVQHLSRNLEAVQLSLYFSELSSLSLCPGVTLPELQTFAMLPLACDKQTNYYLHVTHSYGIEGPSSSTCVRSKHCDIVTEEGICKSCKNVHVLLQKKAEKRKQNVSEPLNKNDPLHTVSKEKLKIELKEGRRTEKKLKEQVDTFKQKLATQSVPIDENLHKDIEAILSQNKITDPLTKLFWEEQKQAFKAKGPRGKKWHPMMIRLALLLHSRGPSAYNTLRETGVLKLPGESTLRDYTNYIHPKAGFNSDVLKEIKTAADKLDANQKFVVLLHDEMSIKEDLVFDKKSGEVIGFLNIQNWSQDVKTDTVLSHVMVFYVVGLNSNLKVSMGFFGTRSATADAIYTIFWEAIGFLEQKCGLKVIASTSDKASPNQRLYQMHGDKTEICHKTLNFFDLDRFIYFFSDVPHLMKTVRNNILKSGPGKTMLLWKNGKDIVWQHIAHIYFDDRSRQLVRTKLTKEHIYPSGRTLMNVKLAAQVLSRTVGLVLKQYGGDDRRETADFILKIDRFFDCLNTRALEGEEAKRKNKPDLKPYRDINDARFQFLDEFLTYLIEWKQSVQTRQGNFTKAERAKMFLTHQTFKGLIMTIRSFKDATHYLLGNGVEFVLSNKFCQDALETHFGRHRSLSRRSENPSLHTFGYQENKIRMQRSLAMTVQPQGNIERKKRTDDTVVISTSPLKKAKH